MFPLLNRNLAEISHLFYLLLLLLNQVRKSIPHLSPFYVQNNLLFGVLRADVALDAFPSFLVLEENRAFFGNQTLAAAALENGILLAFFGNQTLAAALETGILLTFLRGGLQLGRRFSLFFSIDRPNGDIEEGIELVRHYGTFSQRSKLPPGQLVDKVTKGIIPFLFALGLLDGQLELALYLAHEEVVDHNIV
jgi:hypothetical protein